MFPFPALLSRPPSLGRKGGERKRVAKGVVGRRRMEGGARNEEGKKRLFREVTFARLSLVSADLSPSLNTFLLFFAFSLSSRFSSPALKIFQNMRKSNIFEESLTKEKRIFSFRISNNLKYSPTFES